MTEPSAPNPTPGPQAPQPAPAAALPAAAPAPAPAATAPAPSAPAGPKIKIRLPFQRACNEKNEKGKLCAGHLKRWYGFGDDIRRKYGDNAEVYRCEYCHTLYLPAPGYEARTGTLQF